jgi:sugar phosphate isomerase/epimerase
MKTTRRSAMQALAALAIAPLDAARGASRSGFSLKCFATDWGNQAPYDEFCAKAKSAGFDGGETGVSLDPAKQAATVATIRKHGLEVGMLIGGREPDVAAHYATFAAQLPVALAEKPAYVNCHTGRDWFDAAQNQRFFELCHEGSRRSGIPIHHETHRSRALYSAAVAKEYLRRDSSLRLTFDISHWCVVSESLLADQGEAVDLAISRSDHIHARVGQPQAPQVSDPRAPEWEAALNAHLAWWDRIVALKKAAGAPLTMLSEFGPVPYTPALPYTRAPVSDAWQINVWMMELFRKRYA